MLVYLLITWKNGRFFNEVKMLEKNHDNRDERVYFSSTGDNSPEILLKLLQNVVMASPFGHVITAMDEQNAPIVFVNTILGVAGCHVNAYRPKTLKRKARGDNNQQ